MEEVASSEDLLPGTRELYRRLWTGEEPGPLREPVAADKSGLHRAYAGLRGEVARLVDEKDRIRHTLTDREREFGEAVERYGREVREWRDEALQLRHENDLLKKRAEFRFGERLRRAWRRVLGS